MIYGYQLMIYGYQLMIWISAYDMDISISGYDIPIRQNTLILTQTAPHRLLNVGVDLGSYRRVCEYVWV